MGLEDPWFVGTASQETDHWLYCCEFFLFTGVMWKWLDFRRQKLLRFLVLFFFFNVLSLVYFIYLSIQAKRDCTGHCDWGLLLFFSTLGSCLAESELASVSLCWRLGNKLGSNCITGSTREGINWHRYWWPLTSSKCGNKFNTICKAFDSNLSALLSWREWTKINSPNWARNCSHLDFNSALSLALFCT